jgi:hypothetical protein
MKKGLSFKLPSHVSNKVSGTYSTHAVRPMIYIAHKSRNLLCMETLYGAIQLFMKTILYETKKKKKKKKFI